MTDLNWFETLIMYGVLMGPIFIGCALWALISRSAPPTRSTQLRNHKRHP